MKGSESMKTKYFMSTHGPVKVGQEAHQRFNGRQTYSSINTTAVTISDKIHDELINRALKRSKETDKVLSRGNRRLIVINDEV